MAAVYDRIGKGYVNKRTADPRIFSVIHTQLGDSATVLNIGAGTGSYEPDELEVVALEPSMTMISQRPGSAAPAVQGVAENLPFADKSFDLAMGVLTLHHWSDWQRGLKEAVRVSGGNVLLLTWFGDLQHFWLADYFPEIATLDRDQFPPLEAYERLLGGLSVSIVPIPHDCTDGFMCSYWRRPEAYLDPEVRNSISTFSSIADPEPALAQLKTDLDSGRWEEKYGYLLEMDTYDPGYRVVRSGKV